MSKRIQDVEEEKKRKRKEEEKEEEGKKRGWEGARLPVCLCSQLGKSSQAGPSSLSSLIFSIGSISIGADGPVVFLPGPYQTLLSLTNTRHTTHDTHEVRSGLLSQHLLDDPEPSLMLVARYGLIRDRRVQKPMPTSLHLECIILCQQNLKKQNKSHVHPFKLNQEVLKNIKSTIMNLRCAGSFDFSFLHSSLSSKLLQ